MVQVIRRFYVKIWDAALMGNKKLYSFVCTTLYTNTPASDFAKNWAAGVTRPVRSLRLLPLNDFLQTINVKRNKKLNCIYFRLY
jgi:hypothetical protein